MSPIGALIVDDEPPARATIAQLLADDADIEILGQCGSGTEAIESIRKLRPALLFLDVQMPGCDGFTVLESLGSEVPPAVVFVTAFDQYAVKAFEAEALDYLLKPYDDARFFRVLARAKAALTHRPPEQPRPNRILVRNAGRISFVSVAELDWVEAADYYVCLHVGAKSHLLRRSMADMEQELGSQHFCRIHRSAIVNLSRVADVRLDAGGEYEAVLHSGARVKISRSYREKLLASLEALDSGAGL